MNAPRQRFADLPAPQQAGILCNDPGFRRFAAIRCGLPRGEFNSSAAAQYLRDICKIGSRCELATNPRAAEAFQRLRTEFERYRGKITAQR
jgi:hypothetical protein